MRILLTFILCALSAVQTGCSLVQQGAGVASGTMKSLKPSTRGYADDNDENYVDPWADAGNEGRGDRPREKESDRLTKYVDSPKSRAISKSLGYD